MTKITELPAGGTAEGSELGIWEQHSSTVTMTETTISALASDNSFNDSADGFVTAGFAEGDTVVVSGFTESSNNLTTGVITAITAGKMTIGGTDGDGITDEVAGDSVTISKWVTVRLSAQEVADLFSQDTTNVNAQTGTSYTLVIGDANDCVTMNNGSANTLTIPAEASVAFAVGTVISVIQLGAGTTTVTGDTGVTVNGTSAGSADLTAQHSAVSLIKIASDNWNLAGDHGGVS